jgi:exopolysaccharide biosynthesis polyprenyl glycosylphosphotransferase
MRRILSHYVASPEFTLQILEILLIAAGCGAAIFYCFSGKVSASGLASSAAILSLGIVGLMHSGGLYRDEALLDLRRASTRIAMIAIPIFALAVWTTGELARHTSLPIYPYRWQWTVALTGIWIASALAMRVLYQTIHRSGLWTRRIFLIGTGSDFRKLDDLARLAHYRFRVVGYFDVDDTGNSRKHFPPTLDIFAGCGPACEIVVVVGQVHVPWDLLARSKLSGIRVTDFLDFYERESREVCIEKLRDDWIALSREFNATGGLKRSFDVVFASVMFILTAPLLLLTMLAIKLEDGGSIFYGQERTGFLGKPFILYKLRSMREDAERDGTPAWASKGDKRVTRVGRLIRKLRIDELPQLINVLCGEMSMIGPRPERPFFVRQFSETIPFYDYRHAVKPGITGWAQVSFQYGASLEDTQRKLCYDLYYVRNWSLFFDLTILFKTIGVVLSGEGAR